MDSSRRAVEAYWRSRTIDGVTSDEDRVAPVYKLEEVCELLRSSPAGIVKEVSDYILKRLDHKSPIVKQKALRLIKFAVGKSGVDFRREMQRHSAAVRQLAHYKGYPDPLKGDALNKAVRETANETVSAIFASEESKIIPAEGTTNRIEGFGNSNFSRPVEDKKSFLTEVVDLGKASIVQGLSNFATSRLRENDENGNYGSYKSPNLRRSLTSEVDRHDGFEGGSGSWSSIGEGNNSNFASRGQDFNQRTAQVASTNLEDGPSFTSSKTREEKLLETIVTPGGVRLQPTRDAIQAFLTEASKLNPLPMCRAIELKLQSNLWQVRMKAICLLEAILRKKDDEQLAVISSYFGENKDSIIKCADSPQVSLREKAGKVLSLLQGEASSGKSSFPGQESLTSQDIPVQTPLSDLIDTSDSGDYGNEDFNSEHVNQNFSKTKSSGSLIDGFFNPEPATDSGASVSKTEENPFADVSFHVSEDKNGINDLFSGLVVDEKSGDEITKPPTPQTSELADIFSSNMEDQHAQKKVDVHDLLTNLSVNEKAVQNKHAGEDMLTFLTANSQPSYSHDSSEVLLTGVMGTQMGGVNSNIFANPVYQLSPNIVLNHTISSQPISYGAMNNFGAQQQMQFQNFGSFSANSPAPVTLTGGNQSPVLPDIFRPTNNPVQSYGSTMSSSKKETKAFDFISDHVSAARGAKKVL